MTPVQAMRSALAQYVVFTGRARRSELWWFAAVTLVAYAAAALLDDELGGRPIATSVVALALLVPYLALNSRRLHDIDKSGWWQLMYLLPLVGIVLFVVWNVTDSRPDNRFGPNPKAVTGHKA